MRPKEESQVISQSEFESDLQENNENKFGEAIVENIELAQDIENRNHGESTQKENYSVQFNNFKKQFDTQPNLEEKLHLAVDFMEASLAQGGTPHFRSFWEARRLCLPLFKENISPLLRAQLWAKYSELSKEARRLKDILDEQSAFAVEQIEIAIQALEKEIEQLSDEIKKINLLDFETFPHVLKEYYDVYENLQKKLNFLNIQASRVNALRKELIKTEMRVRHKNKFFQRLSVIGDQIFPTRKDLIKQVSEQFAEHVDQFIKKHFGETSHESLHILREEIKALQGLAKVLTLNTQSFTQTRARLSEAWDQIKQEEKERKKERAQRRIVFKQNAVELEKDISSLKDKIVNSEIGLVDAQKNIEKIGNQMRKVELGREEVKELRDLLTECRKLVQEKLKIEDELRFQEEQERVRLKKERFSCLKQFAEKLVREHEKYDVEEFVRERESLIQQMEESSLTKVEKQDLDRLIKPLRDLIADKKEKALLNLSEDDKESLKQYQMILDQRKDRRQGIKDQLEMLRKAAGSSSLDFEKAMNYKNQINEEKERLEKANQSILEIEKMINAVQLRISS